MLAICECTCILIYFIFILFISLPDLLLIHFAKLIVKLQSLPRLALLHVYAGCVFNFFLTVK